MKAPVPGKAQCIRSQCRRPPGRAGHRGGHPQGQRNRVSALSFAAPGAEASDACDHEEPGPTGRRIEVAPAFLQLRTSCRAGRSPARAPSLDPPRCPGPRVGAGWVELLPPLRPGMPGDCTEPRKSHGGGSSERRGQPAAFSKLSGVWTTEDPPDPAPPPRGLESRGGRGPALRPRLFSLHPASHWIRDLGGLQRREWKGLGQAQRQGSLGAHCTRRPEEGLPGDSVPVGAARGPRRLFLRPPCVPLLPKPLSSQEAPETRPSRRPRRAGAPRSGDPGERTRAHSLRRARSSPRRAAELARGAGRTGAGECRKCRGGEMRKDCPRG